MTSTTPRPMLLTVEQFWDLPTDMLPSAFNDWLVCYDNWLALQQLQHPASSQLFPPVVQCRSLVKHLRMHARRCLAAKFHNHWPDIFDMDCGLLHAILTTILAQLPSHCSTDDQLPPQQESLCNATSAKSDISVEHSCLCSVSLASAELSKSYVIVRCQTEQCFFLHCWCLVALKLSHCHVLCPCHVIHKQTTLADTLTRTHTVLAALPHRQTPTQ